MAEPKKEKKIDWKKIFMSVLKFFVAIAVASFIVVFLLIASYFDGKGTANENQVVEQKEVAKAVSYPTSTNPTRIKVGPEILKLPEVPVGKRIRFIGYGNGMFRFRDESWTQWASSALPGTTNLVSNGLIVRPEIQSATEESLYVGWYYADE